MRGKTINVGDKVLLTLAGAICPKDLKRYDGQSYRVSCVKYVGQRPTSKPTTTSYSRYYELEGVVSSVGEIPYSVLADWLIPLGDMYD